MPQWTPDPTFYPSPKMAMEAPPETLAYLAMLDPTRQRPDAMAVVDVNPSSKGYGHLVGRSGPAFFADSHYRYQARPPPTENRESHRAGNGIRTHRL